MRRHKPSSGLGPLERLLLRLFWEREAERKTDGEKWPFLDMQIHLPSFLPVDGLIDDWEISEELEFWLWEPACCGLVVTAYLLKGMLSDLYWRLEFLEWAVG